MLLFESEFHIKTKDCFTPAEKKIIEDYIYNRNKIVKIDPTMGNRFKRLTQSFRKSIGSIGKIGKKTYQTGKATKLGQVIEKQKKKNKATHNKFKQNFLNGYSSLKTGIGKKLSRLKKKKIVLVNLKQRMP